MTTDFTPEEIAEAGEQYDWNHVSMWCMNWALALMEAYPNGNMPDALRATVTQMLCVARFTGQRNVLGALKAIEAGHLPSIEDANPIVPHPVLPQMNEGGGGK